MSDFLLSPTARRLLGPLGLPIPLPEPLRRASGPWTERPLEKTSIAVGAAPGGALLSAVAGPLAQAGASALLSGAIAREPFREAGQAWGRPPRDADLEGEPADALLFDASGIADPRALRALYDFFHPWTSKLARSGRAIVLGRLGPHDSAATAAAQRALEGFTRSLAKEIGRRGATAELVLVERGAEERIAGPLRFLLSPRSAFVSGQVFEVTGAVAAPPEIPWVRPLDGKVALVTGAARGIGKATAERLAAEGAKVVCADRPEDDAPLAQVARAIGGSVLLCDVSAPEAPRTVLEALGARGVDVVVHNAGITRDKTIARMEPEKWEQAVAVNLDAVVRITDALLSEGALRDHGRLVLLSSVAGIAGNLGQTNYAASKAGLIGLARALAPDLAARGITINAVAPGFIETRLTAAIPTMIREVGRRLSALGQGGLPIDVAETITFLASPGACGLSGGVVRVCGGAFLGA